MRLALALLACAALLSLVSWRIGESTLFAVAQSAETPSAPRAAVQPSAPDANAAAPGVAISAPSLFRALTAPPETQAPQPGQRFRLVGRAGADAAPVVLLRDEADNQTFSVRVGDHVRDWVVESIEHNCVVLRQARRRQNACLS